MPSELATTEIILAYLSIKIISSWGKKGMTKHQQEGWFILEDFSQNSLRSPLTVLILTKSLRSKLGYPHARQSTNTGMWLSTNQLWLSIHPLSTPHKGWVTAPRFTKEFKTCPEPPHFPQLPVAHTEAFASLCQDPIPANLLLIVLSCPLLRQGWANCEWESVLWDLWSKGEVGMEGLRMY
jgi:hypothetical protein